MGHKFISVDLRFDLDQVLIIFFLHLLIQRLFGIRFVFRSSECKSTLVHPIFQNVELLMLNHTFSEVMSIVEEVLNRDGIEPLSASNIACEKSTEHCNSECDTESSELVACLLIGCALCLIAIATCNKIAFECCLTSSCCNDSREESSNDSWNSMQVEHSASIVQN